MTSQRITRKSTLGYALLFLAFFLGTTIELQAALKYGHIRARTRGFVQGSPGSNEDKAVEDSAATTSEIRVTPRPVSREVVLVLNKRSKGLFNNKVHVWLFGEAEKKVRHSGYLAYGAPAALRFSDEEEIHRRPPSPALPEFNVLSGEYMTYLTQKPLSDGDIDFKAMSEIVIELEPHTVVSGVINSKRSEQEEQVDHFKLEETQSTVLRAEEVLIFFESDGVMTNTNAIIPFSPATPAGESIKSSATLNEEK